MPLKIRIQRIRIEGSIWSTREDELCVCHSLVDRAPLPGPATAAQHIGGHDIVRDATSGLDLDLDVVRVGRFDMSVGKSRAEGYVLACRVGVDHEHQGIIHPIVAHSHGLSSCQCSSSERDAKLLTIHEELLGPERVKYRSLLSSACGMLSANVTLLSFATKPDAGDVLIASEVVKRSAGTMSVSHVPD